jgi:fatty acid amide hydrolase 2
MDEEQILCLSAAELARGIREEVFTAPAVVGAHIRRIEQINPRINGLAAERFEAARAEAAAVQHELRQVSREQLSSCRPLLGVPYTSKEMIAVAGMPVTYGSRARLGRRAERDATVNARLRAAGAIPLGVSNMPEWGMWNETYNDVYGRTNNPYDVRRTPGGSSGGEGALVGAGCSAFGVGSDIGGSIRMPAAFCGVYAHKPGSGIVPLTGHYPVFTAEGDAQEHRRSPFLSIGPFTRSASDLMPLLRVMQGPDGVDPNAEHVTLGDPAAVDWRGRRVLLLPAPRIRLTREVSRELRHAVRCAGEVLERAGAHVSEAPADFFMDAGRIWSAAVQAVGGPAFAALLGGGEPVQVWREIARGIAGRRRWSWPALLFCALERVGRRDEPAIRRVLDEADALGRAFDTLLGDDGVLISPVHPRVAPRHHEPAVFGFGFLHTAIYNVLRVPVTVAPLGFDGRGLPLAVQVASVRGNDHVTIAAALALEQAGVRWRPAPPGPCCVAAGLPLDTVPAGAPPFA